MSSARKQHSDYDGYADAYVALALIVDCRTLGLFEVLRLDQAARVGSLAKSIGCDESWLKAALGVLESHGWVSKDTGDVYRPGPDATPAAIPQNIALFFTQPVESYFPDEANRAQLGCWLEAAPPGRDLHPLLARALLLPILLSWRAALNSGEDPGSCLSRSLPKGAASLLRQHAWFNADKDALTLTTNALQRLNQIDVMDIARSYASFVSEASGEEIPDGAIQTVIDFLNQHPVPDRPGYLVGLGPCSARFLKRIHARLSENGICKNDAQLPRILLVVEETPAALRNIPHTTVRGGGNLADLEAALLAQGISDMRRGLFIGNLAYGSWQSHPSWRDRFEQWSRFLKTHGAVFLERCYKPCSDAASGFPLTQSLLARYMIAPESLMVTAASQGVFAKAQPVICSARPSSPLATIYAHFESRDYVMRHARMADLAALEMLEERCWAPHLRTPIETLTSRLRTYPEGQFVLELAGQVTGAIYSQRIDSTESLRGATAQDVLKLHRADGRFAQLVAVNVLPEQQHRHFGDQLLEFMLQRCSLTDGVESVVAVTLCKDYYRQSDASLSEYIERTNEFGSLVDPILRFHQQHGARVEGLIPGYRPMDDRNRGNGVLVCYDTHQRKREEIRVTLGSAGSVQEVVESLVKARMSGSVENVYSKDRPLMELGLDSTDLLTLNDAMRGKFGLQLDSTFFFRYNTVEKIAAWLNERPEILTAPANRGFIAQESQRPESPATDVAIIGMACRLPGNVRTPEELWSLLIRNQSAIGSVPETRWQWPDRSGSILQYPGIDRGGFVESADSFDAEFFRISPREAQWMDPQHRLLLELSWEALEDAGYGARQLFDSDTAVYVGASASDYRILLDRPSLDVDPYMGTGNSMAVLANRLSYFHGFRGPSLTIDTACSASLVALHHAVRGIQRGESPQALVAGVNVICDPSISLSYYKAGMLSPDGLCRTFDEKANGYVRSEGAVVLLIKPLAAAIRDGDPIHALIKGTACNHGGQAAGLTAPNPHQQAALLLSAWNASGVSADTLGYIEAHGSATPLGDTIEADGLKEAFQSLPSRAVREKTVGLGSVKSNLGHLEAAAGLAGLLKAVLCLKKKQLVATINFERLNPRIDFSDSILYIVDSNRPWTLPDGAPLRRAGISSFGSGGTNAHAVLEEYQPPVQSAAEPSGPFAIALSARSSDRLRASARRLLEHLNNLDESRISLAAIANTLARREAMEVRADFLVQTVSELKGSLAALAEGREAPAQGKHLSGNTATHSPDKIAGAGRDRRIHLPPYPFARNRHWIPSGSNALSHHSFRWRFTGDETVFRDHVVAGERVLPGVAYLEMVRAAFVESAAGASRSNDEGIRLTDVVWLLPVVAGETAIELQLAMRNGSDGRIAYEFITGGNGSREVPAVHNQGTAERVCVREIPAVDIHQRKSFMTLATLSHNQCYETLAARGFDYGPTHRGIETLFSGPGQVLARLRPPARLPSSTPHDTERTESRSALMDVALQAALFGLAQGAGEAASLQPRLPFAVQQVDLISDCLNAVWAWIRPSATGPPEAADHRFDIDMCDEQGRVCVRFKGLAFRALPRESPPDLTIMCPAWDVFAPAPSALSPDTGAHLAVVGGTLEQHDAIQAVHQQSVRVDAGPRSLGPNSIEELSGRLGSLAPLDHLVYIAPDTPLASISSSSEIVNQQRDGVLQVFRLVKALHALGYGRRELSWTIITTQSQPVIASDVVNPAHAGIHGLAGSMAKEHPHWKIRILDLEQGPDWPVREIFALPFNSHGDALACRRGEWWRPVLIPLDKPPAGPDLCRAGGVYVVIGGAGGLGEVWTRMMILRYRASIIWIGRRELDAAISAKLAALADPGPAPIYIQADCTELQSLQAAYEEIKRKHAHIHGVVHAALVLRDESLGNIDEERFRIGLASKLDVSVRIAQVFEREPLDFVLFFSSILAFEKAPGQSSYAAGCTFSDALAARLAQDWPCAVRVVNWGYWGSVGAVASASFTERMARRGFASIEPGSGMAALQQALESPLQQLVIVAGAPSDIQSQLAPGDRMTVYPDVVPKCPADFSERVRSRLREASVEQLTGGLQTPAGMHRLLLQLLQGTLQALLPCWKETVTVAELKAAVTGPGFLKRWLDQSISVLRDAALINWHGPLGIKWQRLDLGDLWSLWERAKTDANATPSPQIALLESCLRSLPLVLTGEQTPTDLLFGGSNAHLLESLYRGNPASDFFNSALQSVVTGWIEARLSQDSSAQIRLLEIGAGTGGVTADLLPLLDRFHGNIAEYCFTDISKAFLIRAEDRFARRHSYVTTRLFDVSRPIAGQAIDADLYDLAIASNVLHATPDIRRTLRNVKASMRRNGLLVLNELSAGSLFTHLTFGLLPGWWLYEDPAVRIPGCPGLSPRNWAAVLLDGGFRSVMFPAEGAHGAGQQIVVAESDGIVRQSSIPTHQSFPTASRPPVAKEIVASGTGHVPEQMLEDHVRATIRESVSDVLRMDDAAIRNDRSFSDYGVDSIVGVQLIRQIGDAYGIALPTMAIFDHQNVNGLTRHLLHEYSERVRQALGIPKPDVPQPLVQPEAAAEGPVTFQRVAVEGPGDLDALRIVEALPQALGDREVRVSVRAFALNYADLLCLRGLYPNMPPYPFTPGLEASGVVVESGRAVTSFRPGDPVIVDNCQRMGTHATMVTCSADDLVGKPEELSFEQACVLPVVTLTMLDAFDRVNLRKGERVLIQTAAGGTGLAAIQLAQSRGAEIYATAGSQEKLDYLQTLGVKHLINYRENDFELEIEKLCQGRGVDVVVNTLPGDFIQKGLRCLAAGGRYVELAMTALKSARNIDLSVLRGNRSFIGVNLPAMARENPERIARLRAEMLRLLKEGIISPSICRVFPFGQLAEAYRFLESRRNIGKIVVRIPETMQYRACLPGGALAPVPVHAVAVHAGRDEPIAVVGMSGRFAASENLDDFWKHLATGTDLVERVSRWDIPETIADSDAPGGVRRQCAHGSFLAGIDLFDPLFFDISGMEAACMDPQQRLMLEEAWKALEDAGYAGEQIHGHNCGVYVGCTAGDYSRLLEGDRPAQAFWGNHGSVIPARISYFLNLRGPAIAVDTACSSSLVAVHLACQGLWSGETDMALAGGVFIQSSPEFYELANRAGMLSPTGRCHTFDARADGFVPGEAVAAIVLRRLRDAIDGGDHIYGVIRGCATNQDGRSNGITAPSAKSQEALERQVYDRFNIDPATIQLIEAHGTGTDLGDPIEFEALNRAFRHYTEQRGFCAIGSVKTNIGHAAMASGVAGVVKLLLSLKHRQMPPSLHYETGNPKIPLEGSPFYVNTRLREWDIGQAGVRRAAISSFGFSGTNAHMVIEGAPSVHRQHRQEPGYLFALSAKSSSQLRQQTEKMVAFCESNPGLDLGNMSFTLFVGRRHCTHRLAVVARSVPELCGCLRKWLQRGSALQVVAGQLETEDPHEDPGLKRHGNKCIDATRGASGEALSLENLALVAELFIRGYRLEYQHLFGEGYSRVPLPAYSFARESYWPPRSGVAPLPETRPAQPASGDWLFVEEELQNAPLPTDGDWTARVRQCAGMSILVVSADDSDRLETLSLLKLLTEAAGCPENLKLYSIAPSEISDNNPVCPDPPDVVLMFAPQRSHAASGPHASPEIRDVFHLSQWLMRCAWEDPIRLFYLYEGTSLLPWPDCEALSGFMRSAMRENDRHVWNLVGAFDQSLESSRSQMLVREWLCNDTQAGSGSFREVRYISSERRIPRLREINLPLPTQRVFRSDRTYLVTGGLGPVGWLLCQEMARRFACTLVILSRGERDRSRQEKCEKLEALGSKVHYYAVDIANRPALRQTWGKIKSAVGAVHGVIHLARLVEDGLIVGQTWESFHRVCAPKVDGTRNLDELTAGEPLDFFALFSSMAAFGIRGSAAYGYSAAFQNAFVGQRNRLAERGERKGHTVSLCWGAWSVDKYMPANRDENLKAAGYGFIGIEDALPYIEAACSGTHAVLGLMKVGDRSIVCERLCLDSPAAPPPPRDTADRLKDRLAEWERQKAAGARELFPPIHEIVSADELEILDPALVNRLYHVLVDEGEISPSLVRRSVVEVVTEVLRLKTIDDTHSFQSYGLDSISATRIAARLERRLKRVVHPGWLIDCPTVEQLAERLENVDRESVQ